MTATYLSRVDYTADGSTSQFAVPFSYIKTADVYLYQNGILDITTAVTWLNPGLVQLAPTPIAANVVELRRQTVDTAMIAVLALGELNPADLNLDYTQLLYLTQEQIDGLTAANLNTANLEAEIALLVSEGVPAHTNNIVSLAASVAAGLTLQQADNAAAAAGFLLDIDLNYTLLATTTLSSPTVRRSGGKVTLGNFNLQFNGNNIQAGPEPFFNCNGTGRVIGSILNPEMYVEWFGAFSNNSNGAATRTAFQLAGNFAIQSPHITNIVRFTGATYLFDTTGLLFTAGAADILPRFIGGGYSNTTVSFSPAVPQPAFKSFGVAGAPSNGEFSGFYLEGNLNNTGVELRNTSFAVAKFAISNNILGGCTLHNAAAGEFSENNDVYVIAQNLGHTCSPINFVVDGGGNISFSGNKIGGMWSCDANDRAGLPCILSSSGCWWYNGELDVLLNNNASTHAAVLLSNQQSSGAPMTIPKGSIRIECTTSGPITVIDAAHNEVYFGGKISGLGPATLGISKLIMCDAFLIHTSPNFVHGAGNYELQNTFTGSAGWSPVYPISNTQDHTIAAMITNGDLSYKAYIRFDVIIADDGTGTCGNIVTRVETDTHSYGVPVPSVTAGNVTVVGTSAYANAPFTANFRARVF